MQDIIKFSDDITIGRWRRYGKKDPYWGRERLYAEETEGDSDIIIVLRQVPYDHTKWYVNFYQPLAFLHEHFGDETRTYIDADDAKNYVDNFLIQIKNLLA